MMLKAKELNDTYNGIQVVVSSIETLNGNKIEDYAKLMYEQYSIGNKSMGILILVSTKDKEAKVCIGEKLQRTISNSAADKIQSSILTAYLKTDNLAQATLLAQAEIIDEVKLNVSADWEKIDKDNINFMFLVFILIFGVGIICCIYLCFTK